MINKDYILRIAERFGRHLAIILRLRQYNKREEALLYIDDLFLQMTGLTTGFINSASEEMLLNMISPLGALNVDKCLWIAVLLKEEADIYKELDNPDESYYRYLKSLFFFLEVSLRNATPKDFDIDIAIEDVLGKLEEYELPLKTKSRLFRYFEKTGQYAKAEDVLFEMLEEDKGDEAVDDVVGQGVAFYGRLMKKSDDELQAGGLSKEEVEEGLGALDGMRDN